METWALYNASGVPFVDNEQSSLVSPEHSWTLFAGMGQGIQDLGKTWSAARGETLCGNAK